MQLVQDLDKEPSDTARTVSGGHGPGRMAIAAPVKTPGF